MIKRSQTRQLPSIAAAVLAACSSAKDPSDTVQSGSAALSSTAAIASTEKQAKKPEPVAEQNLDANGFIRTHEQGTANVHVTNSTLPVSGSLGVNGTLDARQSGTWNVGITNAGSNPVPVTVGNQPRLRGRHFREP